MLRPSVLVTGFEPFDRSPVNPSAEVVRVLATKNIGELSLHTCVLPVVSETAPDVLRKYLDTLRPDFVVCLGEARGRSAINVEQVATNELDFRIPDNSGAIYKERPIIEGGPETYTATLPTESLCEAIRRRGIPASLSNDAGRFLCNQILYVSLHWAAICSSNTRVGFIHLPSLPQQMAKAELPVPTMALSLQVEAIRAVLITILQTAPVF